MILFSPAKIKVAPDHLSGCAASLLLAQRAYVLENSRIVKEGKGADLLQDPKAKEASLGI